MSAPPAKPEKKIEARKPLIVAEGSVVEGKVTGCADNRLQVSTDNGLVGYVELTEVSDEQLSSEQLQGLVGSTQKFVVLRTGAGQDVQPLSLKRTPLALAGLRDELEGTLVEVRKSDNARIIAVGVSPITVKGYMKWLDCRTATNAQPGDKVGVYVNSVVNAREIAFTQKKR